MPTTINRLDQLLADVIVKLRTALQQRDHRALLNACDELECIDLDSCDAKSIQDFRKLEVQIQEFLFDE